MQPFPALRADLLEPPPGGLAKVLIRTKPETRIDGKTGKTGWAQQDLNL